MNSLEDRLVSAFAREAGRAPLPTTEWQGPTYPSVPSNAGSRSARRALVSGAAAVLVIAIVGVAALRRTDRPGAASGAEPWRIGDEFAVSVGEATSGGVEQLAAPGSVTYIAVRGEGDVRVSYSTATYEPTGVIHSTCFTTSAQSSECGDRAWGATWSEDGPFVSWGMAPAGTVYASYDDGVTRQWQRVLGDYPIFRRGDGPTPVIAAYDAAGTVLGRHSKDIAAQNPLGPPDMGRRFDGIPNAWRDEAGDTFRATLRECLTQAGASFPSPNVPVLPPGSDDDVVWNGCIDEAKRDADARFVELGGHLPIP